MLTLDAAYVLGMDHLIGSIEVGKFADFTVLDADPILWPGDVREISIWGTVVGGEKYQRGREWSPESAACRSEDLWAPIATLQTRWSSGWQRPFWLLAARILGASIEAPAVVAPLRSKL